MTKSACNDIAVSFPPPKAQKGKNMAKLSAVTIILTIALAAPAVAQTAPAPSSSAVVAYTTADTTIGTLIADPAAKAVLDKDIPGLAESPSISMAAGMTLRQIQPMAGDKITPAMLDTVDADLKAVKPATK